MHTSRENLDNKQSYTSYSAIVVQGCDWIMSAIISPLKQKVGLRSSKVIELTSFMYMSMKKEGTHLETFYIRFCPLQIHFTNVFVL